MTDSPAPTHTAFAMKQEHKRRGRWLEIGTGRMDSNGIIHVFLDRTPIGGFNGYVYLAPIGTVPPSPEPDRPGRAADAESE